MTVPKAWLIRMTSLGYRTDALGVSAVAIGFSFPNDLGRYPSRADMLRFYQREVPNTSPGYQRHSASQLLAFRDDVQDGDYVLTPVKQRMLRIGRVRGEYEFNPGLFEPKHPHVRRVTWVGTVPRDNFPTSSHRILNDRRTVIPAWELLRDIEDLMRGTK